MGGEWKECALGEVIELKRGYDLPQQDRRPGYVPIVSSSGVTDYHAEAMVKGPGVVTGRYGTLGEVFYVEQDFWPLNTTLYVRDFKGNDPRFISYFLRGLDFFAYVDKAAVPGINRNHLHQARVIVPTDVGEQRAIAHILGTLDDKIELNRRMSETLEAMARALFKSWFVDFDPVRAKMEGRWQRGQSLPGLPAHLYDLFPDRLVDSELGEIPEGWGVKSIGDLAEVVGGSTPKTECAEFWDGGTHHWVTPKDLSGLSMPVLLDTERKITDAGLAQISSGLLPRGTVLLSSRAPIGYLAIAEVPVAVNQGFIAMKPRQGVSNLFLLRWARAAHDEILSHANGSTFLEISKASFRPIRVVTPPTPIMDAFDQFSRPMYGKVVENALESRTLAALRDALLPKLISGEIRVKDAERFLEERGL
ncbi:restriction endonuclease subunit S [Meiothermus ruber]|jgi:type I restriction enzyme S subunit|uniref:Restriction modification system DNA specificity domain protein n=1 Tax=Meiothermus ruber (strain ATCC 35948 / DSM 1279 / VKM B-1258 / 21) TaxID=504728 RepID=D3PM97_MEIRD|nr:restriction endonuclease subunit S [Meiothermus ruber]ADD29203.1 restriction modification system DNA specificity domain protein [Meiothermus ruber DSM 1279]AGK05346.1 restriction modification system DNA specificity domain-containing protein [Meiothermus ruber DSM 1279]